MHAETTRARKLLDAQAKAVELFTELGRRELIAPGQSERAVSDRVHEELLDLG
jgi:hypothetical protein